MNKADLFENLLKWLQTFECASGVSSALELSDGVIIAKTLHTISSDCFSEDWLSKIKPDSGSNWRLKVSNLKKIVKAVRDFYSDCLDMHINNFETPDINSIGESASPDELGALLQLVLGCAVSCADKEKYIQLIMGMEEQFQQSIMLAIKDLMDRPRAESDVDKKLKKALEDCYSAVQAKEEMSQRCHELDYQVSALQEERTSLQAEVERLTRRVESLESAQKAESGAAYRTRALEEQVELMQEELCRLEAQRQEAKARADQLEREKEDLLRQSGNLAALRDELDVLRERQATLAKTEAALEQMRRKAEDASELRSQLKLLQQQGEESLRRRLELEEENERLLDSRRLAESLREQLATCQAELSEERKRAERAALDLAHHVSRAETLEPELEKLRIERDSLREANEDLEMQVKLQADPSGKSLALEDDEPEFLGLPLRVKEKLLRLERDNRRLKESQESSEAGGNVVQDLRRQVSDQLTARGQLEAELQRQRQRMLELEDRAKSGAARVKELSEQLARREEEARGAEERYKRYLERAKSVIRALDTRATSHGLNETEELGALKQQLVEKDRVIEQLERAQEKSQKCREMEDRLMVSAWYSLGMQLNQGVAGEYDLPGGGGGSPGQTFLQRQRMAHLQRPGPQGAAGPGGGAAAAAGSVADRD
ncbi:hypothetical protein BOX15_Mlig006424g1 [Macrostomum lignano]|uniref:Calponin-homology (CH) domain-containing protein n=2 Tax=Macrostomum lignano TaxID=282301 RepID=A0A1I8J7I9_9PLAT|nr:hypothetical protein BOX15_Mlig006424g1 [Macrostomum lignano]